MGLGKNYRFLANIYTPASTLVVDADEIPQYIEGIIEGLGGVVADEMAIRKYDKSMSGLVCNCIPFLERRVTNK